MFIEHLLPITHAGGTEHNIKHGPCLQETFSLARRQDWHTQNVRNTKYLVYAKEMLREKWEMGKGRPVRRAK